MTPVLAGLLLGAAGSVHCLAMCGPLVLALRVGVGAGRGGDGSTGLKARESISLYHGARIATYAAAGVIAGFAGQALALANLGRALSVAAGLSLIVLALRRAGLSIGAGAGAGGRVTRVLSRVMAGARRRAEGRPIAGLLAAGAINALLPCGLVYAALAAAAAMGSMPAAAAFMVSFGLGTLPALAAAPLLAGSVPASVRSRLRLAVPAALAAVGVLLIARGLVVEVNPTPQTHLTHR